MSLNDSPVYHQLMDLPPLLSQVDTVHFLFNEERLEDTSWCLSADMACHEDNPNEAHRVAWQFQKSRHLVSQLE